MDIIALVLQKLFGPPKLPMELSGEGAEEIIRQLGSIIAESPVPPGYVADEDKLPYPKETIREALGYGLRSTADRQMREHLKYAYIALADWQKNVGPDLVKLETERLDPNEPLEVSKNRLDIANNRSHWHTLFVKREQISCKHQLEKLGLW
jgi:hypothetical protein